MASLPTKELEQGCSLAPAARLLIFDGQKRCAAPPVDRSTSAARPGTQVTDWMITVSPELLATMRMLPRLLVIAAVSAAFVLPAASFVRKPEQAVKKAGADATPLSPTQKLLQPVQLAAAVGLLVELPCYARGRRPALGWRLSIEYFAFFAVVTLPRATVLRKIFFRGTSRGAGERRRRRRVRPIPAERLGGPLARGLRGARGWINSRELFALRIAGTAIGAVPRGRLAGPTTAS